MQGCVQMASAHADTMLASEDPPASPDGAMDNIGNEAGNDSEYFPNAGVSQSCAGEQASNPSLRRAHLIPALR